ncbi:MAG: FkbM family methyltransferase [Thermoleophilia bacterium]
MAAGWIRALVYDVGVHTGEDTGYYLRRGMRVVGVEANPLMCDRLREEFAPAIAAGRLTLVNAGIAPAAGESEFYVCDDLSEWSSFDRSIAGRDGARHHAITVETRTFAGIVAEFGTPWYCKVDIEGSDRLCLEGLRDAPDLPAYVSVEMSHEDAGTDIALMRELGYTRFKIVSQTTWSQPRPLLTTVNGLLPWSLSERFRALDRRFRGVSGDGSWRYPPGSSGPLSEAIPGPWSDADAATGLWRQLRAVDARRRPGFGNDWYDVHATW